MDALKEYGKLGHVQESIKERVDSDTALKIGAILRILEIGDSSIAHCKTVLHLCEELLDSCSLAMGTKKDV